MTKRIDIGFVNKRQIEATKTRLIQYWLARAFRYMGSTLVKWSLPSHRSHFTPPESLK